MALGCGELRLFGEWAGIEPKNDVFDFAATDELTSTANLFGIQIAGVLLYATDWALPEGLSNQKTFPMRHLDDWADFVQHVAVRYRNKVDSWEVWNEPNSPTFNAGNNSPFDYAALVRTARAAIRSAGVDAKVGLTVANYDVRYLRQAISGLARQRAPGAFDFLAVHPYELVLRLLAPNGELQFLQIVPNLRKMLAETIPAKQHAPIRFTEIGASLGSKGEGVVVDEKVAASLLVKAYVLSAVQGVEKVDWFEAADAGASQAHGLMDQALVPRPAFTAYATLTRILGATPRYLGWLAPGDQQLGFGFVFGSRDHAQLVAWAPAGKTLHTVFRTPVQVHDPITGKVSSVAAGSPIPLTAAPLLISDLPRQLAAQAHANARQAFPWGARVHDAKHASVILGPTNIADGLEQTAREATRPIEFADGSTGAQVNVGNGNAMYFAVHPSFADYDTREVFVRVTARTLKKCASGHIAGMNLYYQSVSGEPDAPARFPYDSAGSWFAVPDDQEWHTWVWHLTDAMFVHTFGYGFYLQFDASDPFVIGKVELSKAPF